LPDYEKLNVKLDKFVNDVQFKNSLSKPYKFAVGKSSFSTADSVV
jgi:hypothetical protein